MFSKQSFYDKKSLQVHSSFKKIVISKCARRTSFFTSFLSRANRRAVAASLTFEAAVLTPVIICVMCAFFWLIMVFRVQITIQSVMWEVAEELSGYAYLYEQVRNLGNEEAEYIKLKDTGLERWLVGGITEQYIENEIVRKVGKDSGLWDIVSKEEIEVQSMLSLPDANGAIDLVVTYSVKNPFLPVPADGMTLIQRCYIKAWLGYDIRDEEEPASMVYVAETGVVYHTYNDCTYLKPNVQIAAYNMGHVKVGVKIYQPCEVCIEGNLSLIGKFKVYITETGDKYHKDISCRTLKRTVYEMTLEEALAERYRKCSRCEKREE